MTAFTSAVSIINRGIQRLGGNRISALTDVSKEAVEAVACYDGLRRSELRRNTWRFSIRRVILRAVGTSLPTWDGTVTYVVGSLITYNSVNYISIHATNLNQNPVTATSYWSVFTGNTSQKVTFPAWSSGTTYAAGLIVTGSDGLLYLSLVGTNLNHDPTADTAGTYWQLYFGPYVASAYDSGTTYYVGEVVFDTAQIAYYSTANNNANAPSTGIGWVTLAGATLAPLVIPWPAGTGPATEFYTRYVFVLPYGFLRQAPLDPHAGDASFLGFPSNPASSDWLLEGSYLTSRYSGPLLLRFAADITQVSLMDDLFCEMLGNRIAYELCETLTNSGAKQQAIGQEYTAFRGQAVAVNGIETGSVQPPLDDWIATRA